MLPKPSPGGVLLLVNVTSSPRGVPGGFYTLERKDNTNKLSATSKICFSCMLRAECKCHRLKYIYMYSIFSSYFPKIPQSQCGLIIVPHHRLPFLRGLFPGPKISPATARLETAAAWPRPPCPGCRCEHRLAAAASLLLPPSAITSAGTPGFFSVGWKDKKEHVEKQQTENYVRSSKISGWLIRFSPKLSIK